MRRDDSRRCRQGDRRLPSPRSSGHDRAGIAEHRRSGPQHGRRPAHARGGLPDRGARRRRRRRARRLHPGRVPTAGHRGGRRQEAGRRGHLVHRRDDRAGWRPADLFPQQRGQRAIRRLGRRPGAGAGPARGRTRHPLGHGPPAARRGQRLVRLAPAGPGRGPAHQHGNGQPGTGPHHPGRPALPALPGQHRDQRTRGRRADRHRRSGAHRGRAGGLARRWRRWRSA